MKRLVSIFLAMAMIFSLSGIAVPVTVETVQSAREEVFTQEEPELVSEEVQENKTSEIEEVAVLQGDDDRFPHHPVYGAMIINLDFERENINASALKAGTLVSGGSEKQFDYIPISTSIYKLGAVNPQYSDKFNSYADMYMESARASLYEVGKTTANAGVILVDDEATGNTYAEFPIKGQWPNVELRASSYVDGHKVLYTENGIFTLSGDYLYLADTDGNTSTWDDYCLWSKYSLLRNDGASQVRQYAVSNSSAKTAGYGKWVTLTKSTYQKGVHTFTESGVQYTGEVKVFNAAKYGMTLTKMTTYTNSLYLDNLILYYKPFTANLTIDMNGNTMVAPIEGLTDYSTEKLVDISVLEDSVIDYGDKLFLGFSFSPDGEIIKDDFYLTQDTTIYAIWKNYNKSKYSYEMNDASKLGFVKGTNGSKTTYTFVKEDNGNTYWHITYGADNPNLMIIDSTFDINKNFSSNMPIADIKGAMIRMRYSNVPDFLEEVPEDIYDTDGTTILYPKATSSTTYSVNGKKMDTTAFDFNLYFYTDDGVYDRLTESRRKSLPSLNVSANGKYHDKWFTYYVDFDAICKDANGNNFWTNSDNLKFLRFDLPNQQWDGAVVDVDFVHFIERDDINEPKCDIYFLNGDEKTYITQSITGVDFRKNSVICFDFDRDIGHTAEEFRARLLKYGMTSTVFDAACTYDPENYIYTMYEESSLRGKSFTLGNFGTAFRLNGEPTRFEGKYDNLKITYLGSTVFDDGENLVPNGSFDTPYFVPFTSTSYFTTDVKDSALYVRHTDAVAEWSSYVINDISLKENTNYYVYLDIDHVSDEELAWPVTDENAEMFATLYMPIADSFFNYSTALDSDDIKYIPSLTGSSSFLINSKVIDTDQGAKARVVTIKDDAFYSRMAKSSGGKYYYGDYNATTIAELETLTGVDLDDKNTFGHGLWSSYKANFFKQPGITIQTTLTGVIGKGVSRDEENDKVLRGAEGITYRINDFVIKEMFDVTLKNSDGTVIETRYAPKDIPINLPTYYDEGGNLCLWQAKDGTLYNSADEFVLTTAGDCELVAYSLAVNAPDTINRTSVRTSGYTGIRFLASISSEKKEKTTEYGFIVTRKLLLDGAGLSVNELTFANADKVNIVSKKSYDSETGNDFIYAIDGDTIFFTGLMVGIPEDKLDDVIVVRPYSKVDGVYSYGSVCTGSIIDVAKKAHEQNYCDASGEPLDETTVAYLKDVLAKYALPYEVGAIAAYNAEELYGTHKFASERCRVEIVQDPDDANNHVYKITPNSGSSWSYMWFSSDLSLQLQKGAKYTMTADVKIVDETLYDSVTGEVAELKLNVDSDGYIYYTNNKGEKCAATTGGILQAGSHYPFNGSKVTTQKYVHSTASYVTVFNNSEIIDENGYTSAKAGFLVQPYEYYDEQGNKTVYKFAVYVDNIVFKKVADPE